MPETCPHCKASEFRKYGSSRHGHQRYLCRSCGRTFGDKNHRVIEQERKNLALALYAEGMSARAIERVVGVSHNSVLGWVRKEVQDKAIAAPAAPEQRVVELDEMWSYVGSKKSPSGSGGA